jgi:broad specificity phosphatase PhoE
MSATSADWSHHASPGSLGRLAELVMALDHCLLLVRHGQTQLNLEDRVATHTDVALTRKGHEQATRLTEALTGATFDAAYTSPMRRAIDTATTALVYTTVCGHLVSDVRLVEPSAGPFEGMMFAELEHGADTRLRRAYSRYTDESNPVYPEGAEPIELSTARARAFLHQIESSAGRFFAASHGAFIRILICEFLELDPRRYTRLKLDNCHAALLKFYAQPPHQLVGLHLAPT